MQPTKRVNKLIREHNGGHTSPSPSTSVRSVRPRPPRPPRKATMRKARMFLVDALDAIARVWAYYYR